MRLSAGMSRSVSTPNIAAPPKSPGIQMLNAVKPVGAAAPAPLTPVRRSHRSRLPPMHPAVHNLSCLAPQTDAFRTAQANGNGAPAAAPKFDLTKLKDPAAILESILASPPSPSPASPLFEALSSPSAEVRFHLSVCMAAAESFTVRAS